MSKAHQVPVRGGKVGQHRDLVLSSVHQPRDDPRKERRVRESFTSAALHLPGSRERGEDLQGRLVLLGPGTAASVLPALDAVGAVVVTRSCDLPLDGADPAHADAPNGTEPASR